MDDRQDRDPGQGESLRTYVLTPLEGPSASEEPAIDLKSLVRALWRWKLPILLVPLTLSIALLALISARPDEYEATATLLIQASPIENELAPQSLSLETYQALLMSDPIMMKVKNRL